jgi:hypothetical protein
MKIYRGDRQTLTDSIEPQHLDRLLKIGRKIRLSGTKGKSRNRQTTLWLEIDEHDVIALVIAFLEADPEALFRLFAGELRAQHQEAERLRTELMNLRRRIRDESVQEEIDNMLSQESGTK